MTITLITIIKKNVFDVQQMLIDLQKSKRNKSLTVLIYRILSASLYSKNDNRESKSKAKFSKVCTVARGSKPEVDNPINRNLP